MSRIIINTQNYMFADMIRKTLDEGDFNITIVEKPENIIAEFNRIAANIVLLEVTGYTPWKLDERMKVRNDIKRIDPECKVVFLIDEKAEPQIAAQILQAKTDGLIDQFIFSSISATYLKGVIETL